MSMTYDELKKEVESPAYKKRREVKRLKKEKKEDDALNKLDK